MLKSISIVNIIIFAISVFFTGWSSFQTVVVMFLADIHMILLEEEGRK